MCINTLKLTGINYQNYNRLWEHGLSEIFSIEIAKAILKAALNPFKTQETVNSQSHL